MIDGEDPIRPADETSFGPDMEPLALDNPFWRFSLSVYSSQQVRETCLDAQDRHGVDVNLMLLCCWVGFSGVRLDSAGLKRLDRLVEGWRKEVIGPIRTVRRRLSEAVGPMGPEVTTGLRDDVKDAELKAEQIQQAVLFRALETLPGRDARHAERSGVARMNLTVYLRDVRGVGDTAVLKQIVETTVLGCRDELEKEEDEPS